MHRLLFLSESTTKILFIYQTRSNLYASIQVFTRSCAIILGTSELSGIAQISIGSFFPSSYRQQEIEMFFSVDQ